MNSVWRCSALIAVLLAAGMPTFAAGVPVWAVNEIVLRASRTYSNPWMDTSVSAEFRGPGGLTTTVNGFWDGGQTFKIRWTPSAAGRWTYLTQSADPGLNGKKGAIEATRPTAGSHGFLRRDPRNPYSFVFDDGTRYFLFGNTFYGLISNALAGGSWKTSVDRTRAIGMNKIRFAVSRRDLNAPLLPADKIDLPMYQQLDEVVRYLADKDIIADLIFFQRNQVNAYTLEEAKRQLQYAIARYAAFPNVIWCLQNEWEYTKQPKPFWSALGQQASREDPWARRGEYVRGLSIHQQTRYDWQFFGENWYSHVIVQLGVRNRGKAHRGGDEWNLPKGKRERFPYGDDWGNFSIVFNHGRNVPVVNDEYGYIGEPADETETGPDGKAIRYTREKHRHTMWGIYAGGGYGSAGDKNEYADGKPYFSANWHDVPEWDDVKRLIGFFTGKKIEYWKMLPANDLAVGGERVYVLADPARQYVVYAAAGGKFSIRLPVGKFQARRFDPRTAEDLALFTVTGGRSVEFSMPDAQDWVVYLKSE